MGPECPQNYFYRYRKEGNKEIFSFSSTTMPTWRATPKQLSHLGLYTMIAQSIYIESSSVTLKNLTQLKLCLTKYLTRHKTTFQISNLWTGCLFIAIQFLLRLLPCKNFTFGFFLKKPSNIHVPLPARRKKHKSSHAGKFFKTLYEVEKHVWSYCTHDAYSC